MKRLFAIAVLVFIPSIAWADDYTLVDLEEACGIAEWNANEKPETLEECYERVIDEGAIPDNHGDLWNGFLIARKRGLVQCNE
jgi:hypothetical protein